MTRLVNAHLAVHPLLELNDIPDGTIAVIVMNDGGLESPGIKASPRGYHMWRHYKGTQEPSMVICKIYAPDAQYLRAVRVAEKRGLPMYVGR